MSTEDPQFMECAACAAQPGSPTLCPACLHNRRVVSDLLVARKVQTGMAQENEDLWREVAALGAELSTHKGALTSVQGFLEGFLGFVPKTPQAAACLFEKAFHIALRDEEFKKEHEKLMLDWRKRLGKAIAEQRDLRLLEEQVEALSRKVGEVEQVVKHAKETAP